MANKSEFFFEYPDRKERSSICEHLKLLVLSVLDNPLLSDKLSAQERLKLNSIRHLLKNDDVSEGWMLCFLERNTDSNFRVVNESQLSKIKNTVETV